MAVLSRNPQTSRPAFPTGCLSVPGALGGQPPAPPSGTSGFRTKPPTGTLMTADRRPPTPRRSRHLSSGTLPAPGPGLWTGGCDGDRS